ncbi:MAG: BMP family ABC transporter substrate-binding protein [Lachnospiraceae bacterium]|nr:BMP family ABC transporter substrate-binding protein [Lachnospiraceae bacterium]
MNKKLLAPAAVICCAALITGCGGKSGGNRVGVVTGTGGTSDGSQIAAVYRGIESHAEADSLAIQVYTSASDSIEGYAEQFLAAADDNNTYVVCAGSEMEQAVYDAQSSHTNQKYILFGGVPRSAPGTDGTIRSNTECIGYDEQDMAFLAGYASVASGYRNIMFMTGAQSDEHTAAFDAFLKGAGAGVQAGGIDISSVNISVEYAGTELISPLRMQDALNAYDSGIALIVTDSEGLAGAIEKAAELRTCSVATIGFDDRSKSSSVIYSAVANGETAAAYLMDLITGSDGFEGGTLKICGAAERAVGLSADYSRLGSFSEAACSEVLAAMAEGTIGNGTGEESQAQVQLSYTEVSPVMPDGSAGLAPPPTAPTAESGTA